MIEVAGGLRGRVAVGFSFAQGQPRHFATPSMSQIADLLPASGILLDLDAGTKSRLFDAVGSLFETQRGLVRLSVVDSLMAREKLGSTGLGQGIGQLPVGRIKGLKDALGAFVRLLGAAELAYLRVLDESGARAAIDRCSASARRRHRRRRRGGHHALPDQSDARHVPLLASWPSPRRLVDVLRCSLSHVLAEVTTLHGVFSTCSVGVLITVRPRSARATRARAHLARQQPRRRRHRRALRISPDTLEGAARPSCATPRGDGVGMLNMRTIFGRRQSPTRAPRLIVHLGPTATSVSELDQLQVDTTPGRSSGCPSAG